MGIFKPDPSDPDDAPWIDFFHTYFQKDLADAFHSGATKLGAVLATVSALVSDIPGLGAVIREGIDHWFTEAGGVASGVEDKDSAPALAGDAVSVALSVGLSAALSGLAAQARRSIFAYFLTAGLEGAELVAAGTAATALAVAVGEALAAVGVAALVVIDTIIAAKEVQAIGEATSAYNAQNSNDLDDGPPPPPHPHPHPSAPPSKHDPLVLDLTGNGINLTALAGSPAYFDYTGSGIPQETGWITAGEGMLVLAPADGKTVTAADLLGAYSGNGFADLAALDSNGDGVINASDAAYSQLRVWVSTDGSTGELLTLAQLVGCPAIFQIPCRRPINRQKPATSFRHPALWARPCSTFPASSSASAAAPFLTKRRPSCRHAVASG